MQVINGMNGGKDAGVSGMLYLGTLDEIMQRTPDPLERALDIKCIGVVDSGYQYPADPLERMLDRWGVDGYALNAATLEDEA